MLRPRDASDQRVLEASNEISPEPKSLRFVRDAFGNHLGIARFSGRSKELSFESTVCVEHSPPNVAGLEIEDYARSFPFDHSTACSRSLARGGGWISTCGERDRILFDDRAIAQAEAKRCTTCRLTKSSPKCKLERAQPGLCARNSLTEPFEASPHLGATNSPRGWLPSTLVMVVPHFDWGQRVLSRRKYEIKGMALGPRREALQPNRSRRSAP